MFSPTREERTCKLPPPLPSNSFPTPIVQLANQIMAMGPGPREKQYTDFLYGTPAQQARIVDALHLTPDEIAMLIVSDKETATSNAAGQPGGPKRQSQPWDYDTATATISDLTARRTLLQTRLRVLQYLRSH